MAARQATSPAAGPVLVGLDRLSGLDESTLETLLRFAGGPSAMAVLVLPDGWDRQDAGGHGAQDWCALGRRAVEQHRYTEADDAFRAGLAYCEQRGLGAAAGELVAGLAESLVEQARYDEADVLLDRLGRGAPGPAARAALSHVAGRAAAQRLGDPRGLLGEAWSLAEFCGDDQRMVQVACARAEAAWIGGRIQDLRAEAHRGWQLASERCDPWALGELAWWLLLAGSRPVSPGPIAAPFRCMLDGGWQAAAEAWHRCGRRLWAAYALGFSASLADARRAVSIGGAAGATAAVQAILRDRRAAGLPVPPRPRSATRANPLQLTRREMEVIGLLAEGLTNSQIASRLYLSERTVAHHVSAVLMKLDQPNRSAAVATAVRQGILPADRSTGAASCSSRR